MFHFAIQNCLSRDSSVAVAVVVADGVAWFVLYQHCVICFCCLRTVYRLLRCSLFLPVLLYVTDRKARVIKSFIKRIDLIFAFRSFFRQSLFTPWHHLTNPIDWIACCQLRRLSFWHGALLNVRLDSRTSIRPWFCSKQRVPTERRHGQLETR